MATAGMKKPFRPRSEEEAQVQPVEQEPQSDETPVFQQQDPERVLQQLAVAPSAKEQVQAQQAAPESDLDRYARLSQEAEAAAPTQEDVLAAGIRRGMAYSRAETPAFLQQMAETAFYKPDYSQMTKVAEEEAKQPDIALSAKEQAQKRLQGLAEAARKKALLPGQMAEQQAKVSETQAKLDMLKPATDEERAAAEQQLGVKFPPGTKKGDIAKATSEATQATIKGRGVPLDAPRRNMYQNMLNNALDESGIKESITLPENVTIEDAKNLISIAKTGDSKALKQAQLELSTSRLELAQRRLDFREQEEERARTVLGYGKAADAKAASKFRNQVDGTMRANAAIDALKKQYAELENTPWTEVSKNAQKLQEIATNTAGLLINLKDRFGLGALQQHEMNFMQKLTGGTSDAEIIKQEFFNKVTGKTMAEKLDAMKAMINRDLDVSKNVYIHEPETKPSQSAAQPAAAPAGQSAAQPSDKITVKDVDGTIYEVDRKKFEAGKKAGNYKTLTPL